jgi:hypothetical protein
MMAGMPEAEIKRRGGAIRYRTIRAGHGKNRRYYRVAIVRKRGPRGGTTVAGPAHTYQGA